MGCALKCNRNRRKNRLVWTLRTLVVKAEEDLKTFLARIVSAPVMDIGKVINSKVKKLYIL
jgi:hypothetical protein